MNRFEEKIVTGWIVAGLGIAAYYGVQFVKALLIAAGVLLVGGFWALCIFVVRM